MAFSELKQTKVNQFKEYLKGFDYELIDLENCSDEGLYCKFDYRIRKFKNYKPSYNIKPIYLMECSTCHYRYHSNQGHLQNDCDKHLLNSKVIQFRESGIDPYLNNKREIKCVSDKILLYLRYGIYTILTEHLFKKPCIVEFNFNFGDIDNFNKKCMEIYKTIRGNEKYVAKNPKCLAAGIITLSFVDCFTHLNLNINPVHVVAKIFSITNAGVRNNYKYIKETENL